MNVGQIGINTIKTVARHEPAVTEVPKALAKGAKGMASSADGVSSYAKAAINMTKKTKAPKEASEEFFEKLLAPDEHIGLSHFNASENVVRMRMGAEIPGFKGLYKEDKFASCYFDDGGQMTYALLYDNKAGTTKLYDVVGGTVQEYSKEDIQALHYYKYNPEAIHQKLRFGRDKFRGDFRDETIKVIGDLQKLFADDAKLTKNPKTRTVYRAVQSGLSADEAQKLKTAGETFTEKSYCSTTTDLDVAKRFAGKDNLIMEITLPEGAEYVDIEKLFNIDSSHWHERELLLNANSKFRITDYNPKTNIVKAEYVG